MLTALFDPYVYRTHTRDSLRTMNAVGDAILSLYDDADPDEVAEAILSAYRPGIAVMALRMHTLRAMRLSEVRR